MSYPGRLIVCNKCGSHCKVNNTFEDDDLITHYFDCPKCKCDTLQCATVPRFRFQRILEFIFVPGLFSWVPVAVVVNELQLPENAWLATFVTSPVISGVLWESWFCRRKTSHRLIDVIPDIQSMGEIAKVAASKVPVYQRGGVGEPYCSHECWEEGGNEMFAALSQHQKVCADFAKRL